MQTNPEPRRVSTQTMVIAGLAALPLFLLGMLLGNLIGRIQIDLPGGHRYFPPNVGNVAHHLRIGVAQRAI